MILVTLAGAVLVACTILMGLVAVASALEPPATPLDPLFAVFGLLLVVGTPLAVFLYIW